MILKIQFFYLMQDLFDVQTQESIDVDHSNYFTKFVCTSKRIIHTYLPIEKEKENKAQIWKKVLYIIKITLIFKHP